MISSLIYIVLLIILLGVIGAVRFTKDWDILLEHPKLFVGYSILVSAMMPFVNVLEYRNPEALFSTIALSIRNFYSVVDWLPFESTRAYVLFHLLIIVAGVFLCLSETMWFKKRTRLLKAKMQTGFGMGVGSQGGPPPLRKRSKRKGHRLPPL